MARREASPRRRYLFRRYDGLRHNILTLTLDINNTMLSMIISSTTDTDAERIRYINALMESLDIERLSYNQLGCHLLREYGFFATLQHSCRNTVGHLVWEANMERLQAELETVQAELKRRGGVVLSQAFEMSGWWQCRWRINRL